MTAQPLVSILMPAHYSQDFIARSVQSVCDQTYKNWELIIIADDLGDYENVLKEQGISDKRIKYASTRRKGGGPSNARNVGLDAANGDYIALLDSDDLFHPEKLERCVPLVITHPLVMAAYQEVLFKDGRQHNYVTNYGYSNSQLLNRPEDIWLIIMGLTNATALFDRRKIPLRWAMNLRVMEDMLFLLEAYHHAGGIYFHNEILHYYVNRSGSLTRHNDTSTMFIQAKQTMIRMLQDNPHALSDYMHKSLMLFLETSLLSEREYSEKCGTPEDVASNNMLFRSIFHNNLRKAGVQIPKFILDEMEKAA